MKTAKDVLNDVVTELEGVEALVATLQDRLIAKGQLSKDEVDKTFLQMQKGSQKRLAGLRAAISELPD